jgi:hypothetical protein
LIRKGAAHRGRAGDLNSQRYATRRVAAAPRGFPRSNCARRESQRRLHFVEHCRRVDGHVVTARQFSTHEVPEALASKALAVHAAVDPVGEQAARLRAGFGDSYATPMDPEACIDLELLDPNIDLQCISAQRVLVEQRAAKVAKVA